MVIISTTVVRLSTLAEMTKVRRESIHRSLRLLRVRSHTASESNTPLLFIISTMVLVAMRKRMTWHASFTYFIITVLAMKSPERPTIW